jgi:hypothetical protein
VSERSRKLGSFKQRACRRQKNANVTARESLQCFDPFARNFGMRLSFAESLSRGIERHGKILIERLDVGEPALCCGDALGNYHEETSGRATSQRRDYCGVAGTKKPREVYARVRRRENR